MESIGGITRNNVVLGIEPWSLAATAAKAFLSRRFRPLSHPAGPPCFCFNIIYLFFCLFETRSHYAVQAGLELTFVAQAGLELTPILLPQPPKCWDYRRVSPCPAITWFFKIYFK